MLNRTMSIGGPAFFLAIGLILYLAVPDQTLGGVDLATVGLIVSIISGIVLLIAVFANMRGTKSVTATGHDPNTGKTVQENYTNL